ncbi:MAG TPA: hypothetical protein PKC14_01750 [Candidatus Absconditabacterales bacterium]|nr:hypothetical protein [Candidatus Absconditabacterales bacterium]
MKHLSSNRKRFAVVMIVLIVFIMLFSTVSTLIMYIGTDQGSGENLSGVMVDQQVVTGAVTTGS